MGRLSTISQLKEELGIHLPDLLFLCETKKQISFVQVVCQKLRGLNNWEFVEPRGFSEGLALGWSDNIIVKQLLTTEFNFEIEFEAPRLTHSCWGIFGLY